MHILFGVRNIVLFTMQDEIGKSVNLIDTWSGHYQQEILSVFKKRIISLKSHC